VFNSRRNAALKFAPLDQVFKAVHENAVHCLLYPFKLGLTAMLKKPIETAVMENNSNLHSIKELMKKHDRSLHLTDPSAQFVRQVRFMVKHPTYVSSTGKENVCWYNDDDPMARPETLIIVPHDQTHGRNHVISVLGQWPSVDAIMLNPGATTIIDRPFTPDVKEAFDFTFQQLQTLNIELNTWYAQFSRGETRAGAQADDGEINTIGGADNYHRIAAAMYYSPVFSQWVQWMKKKGYVKLAPVCDRLTRSNSFRYLNPMSPELHTALSTAFNLIQAVEAGPKEDEDADAS